MKINVIFLFLLIVFITVAPGCASYSDMWNSRIGNYTYDQVVIKHGPPESKETLQNGDVVAKWVVHHGEAEYSPEYVESMVLTFDTHGVLKSWSHGRG